MFRNTKQRGEGEGVRGCVGQNLHPAYLFSVVERVRDVCREYSQRGAPRTHDSAGETPPQTKHKGEVGGSQKDCGRQQLSVSLADGENTQRRDVRNATQEGTHARVHHRDEIGRYTHLPNISRWHNLFVADLQRLEPRDWLGSRPSERRLAGVSALTSHASSGRSPAQPPLVRPLSRED